MSTRDIFSGPEDVFNVMNAKLYPNYMQDKIEGKYYARAHEQTITAEEIAESAARRGGSTANYEDLLAHYRTMEREIAYQLCNGNAVRTDIYSAHSRIAGTFENPHDPVAAHPVTIAFYTGYPLKRAAGRVKLNIEGIAETGAHLREFYDVNTDTVNQMISGGGMCRVEGVQIMILSGPDDKPGDIGLFLVTKDSVLPAIRLRIDKLAVNEPGLLVFMAPEGIPANRIWGVEIRTRYSRSSHPLKSIRVITADWKLTVPAAQEAPAPQGLHLEAE